MEMKKCTKCGVEKPATVEWFYGDKTKACGLRSHCKNCVKINQEANKKYYIEYGKVWRSENKEYHKEYLKEYFKTYARKDNTKYHKEYRLKNKQKCIERSKKWVQNNPERMIIATQKRRALKRNLPSTLTLKEWKSTKDYFNHECAYCGKHLKNLAQDHFWPLSKGGEYTRFNIIPACRSCNSSKHNRWFEEWYPAHESYSPEREARIYKYFTQLALDNDGWGRKIHNLDTVTIEVRI